MNVETTAYVNVIVDGDNLPIYNLDPDPFMKKPVTQFYKVYTYIITYCFKNNGQIARDVSNCRQL